MSIVTRIAKKARANLGRPACRRTWLPIDWEAVDAIKAAAAECGMANPLIRWVSPCTSLTAYAQAFVSRYVQAYGPVEKMIDAGAHIGNNEPMIAEV